MNRFLDKTRHQGVTLTETIIVIALLIMAAVAGSFLLDGEWSARRHVAVATDDVADALIKARNTAITNRATVRVRRVRTKGLEQLLISEAASPFHPERNWVVELGANVHVRGLPRELRFMPTGNANRNLEWTIKESTSSGKVSVSPASGQVIRRLP